MSQKHWTYDWRPVHNLPTFPSKAEALDATFGQYKQSHYSHLRVRRADETEAKVAFYGYEEWE